MAETDIKTAYQAAIDAGKITGGITCATDAQGQFTFTSLIGERTLLSGEKQPYKSDDIVYLASATKLMASIAALTCVEDGLLSLTGDLSSIAPELTSKQVITGFAEDGTTPIVEPQNRQITLEMLITHSSGLVYHFINPTIGKWRENCSPKHKELKNGAKMNVEELINYPLLFQPGSSWMYGPGLDWAGRIVERVTGQTLGERIRQRILKPVGAGDAQFFPVTREDLRDRMVDLNPNDPNGLGLAVVGSGDMNLSTNGDFGGHGLFMTTSDYVKVLQSLLANDGKILEPQTVDLMFEDHLSAEASAGFKEALAGPVGPFFRVGVAPGSRAGYGLGGLLTLEDVEGWYGDRTLTWGGGMTFSWFLDRKNNLCGATAILASLPLDIELIASLKQNFRTGVYRERSKGAQKSTS